jgi:c-di-GMP-binding flagellar brake protein YcgR
MPLTSRQFQEIIGSLRSDALFGRRSAPRVGIRLQVRITPCEQEGPVRQYDAWLRDISMAGVCFVGPAQLEPGSFVVAQFARESAAALSILYEVVRCRKRGDQLYEVGARIERVVTEEELGRGSAA